MAVLVDTNIVLDIVYDDAKWSSWSEGQLDALRATGLLVNPMVYSELCAGATTADEVDGVLKDLGIELIEISRQAVFLASKVFLQYRTQGGKKTSPLPDFFIGAHAQAEGLSLLTRDIGRYRTYFPLVNLLAP